MTEKNQPGERDVGRRQRPLHLAELWLDNPEIHGFGM